MRPNNTVTIAFYRLCVFKDQFLKINDIDDR